MQRPGGDKAGLFKELKIVQPVQTEVALWGKDVGEKRRAVAPISGSLPPSLILPLGGQLNVPNLHLIRIMTSRRSTSFE